MSCAPQPTFAPNDTGTDWNDYATQHRRAAVRWLIEAELQKKGMELLAPLARQAKADMVFTLVNTD